MLIERRHILIALRAAALLFVLLVASGLAVLDRPIASWPANQDRVVALWAQAAAWLDIVTLRDVSSFLLGPILMLAAGLLLVASGTRGLGWSLLFVGIVQFGSTLIADLATPRFGRLRPFEALAEPGGVDRWFAGGLAFPAPAVAFYAGLFFPLMLLLPRWSLLWVLPPLAFAAAGIVTDVHHLSDVAASLFLGALMSVGWSFILNRADAYS